MVQNKAIADGLRGFELALGKEVVDVIEITKDLSLAELGIEIDVLPDAEELAELTQLIEKAITSGSIELEDGMEIKDVSKTNIKKATHLLKKRRKEKAEEDMKKSSAASQANAQAQMQATQAAAQAEAQLKQMEHQQKIAELQMEYSLKMELEKVKAQYNGMAKAETGMVENEHKLQQIDRAKQNNLDDTSLGSGVREPSVFSGVGDTKKLD